MTTQQQRIAIAQACGWTDCHISLASTCGIAPGSQIHLPLPDYPNDLNAMHEAEKVLTTSAQQNRYYSEIADTTWGNPETGYRQVVFNQLTATAAERAEAFLRARNLWTTT